MKIIFLDIDQVMNYNEYDRSDERETKKNIWSNNSTDKNWNRLHFSDSAVNLLNKLIKETKAKVVLCSVWRGHEDWETFLKDVGIKCILEGRTGFTDHSFRGIEVDQYLKDIHNFRHYEWNSPEKDEHDIDSYVIIDDGVDYTYQQRDNIVHVTQKYGFNNYAYKEALRILDTPLRLPRDVEKLN
jgi:hypothetical protein